MRALPPRPDAPRLILLLVFSVGLLVPVRVSAAPDYAKAKAELRGRVEQWMRDTADPRVDPAFDGWDHYPYFGGSLLGKPRKK